MVCGPACMCHRRIADSVQKGLQLKGQAGEAEWYVGMLMLRPSIVSIEAAAQSLRWECRRGHFMQDSFYYEAAAGAGNQGPQNPDLQPISGHVGYLAGSHQPEGVYFLSH